MNSFATRGWLIFLEYLRALFSKFHLTHVWLFTYCPSLAKLLTSTMVYRRSIKLNSCLTLLRIGSTSSFGVSTHITIRFNSVFTIQINQPYIKYPEDTVHEIVMFHGFTYMLMTILEPSRSNPNLTSLRPSLAIVFLSLSLLFSQ